jgi:endoglucanase
MKHFSNYTFSLIILMCTTLITSIGFAQDKALFPSYNTAPLPPDSTEMSSNAWEIAAQMGLGWNIGNTLEATGGETAWGNPQVTKKLIDEVKKNGFNSIRIPCAWDQYTTSSKTVKIKESWFKRVQEVVDYCIENDMYVILNIHWDGGWLENNCTPDKQVENNAKQQALWEQIASYFRDYDERLLFAGTNEPNVHNAEQMAVLHSYLQTFIDVVRATGGRNAYRVLIVQGPSTDIEKTNSLMKTLPKDTVKNRLMVEVHYYTPFNFCGLTENADWGRMNYYWGKPYLSETDTLRNPTWGEEDAAVKYMAMMKEQFVEKGIPVILGEYGAIRRTMLPQDIVQTNLNSRAYYVRYITQLAIENGLIPFYWDEGSLKNHGFGIFNRHTGKVFDYQMLNAIIQGARTADNYYDLNSI